jgi:WD40 repeat protein/serine/threonine protein kinase
MSPEANTAPDRDDRLDEIILAYHEAVEASQPPDTRDFIARHADLADELTAYFASQRRLDAFVAPFRDLASVCAEAGQPLKHFGDCEVIEEIGCGGMGVVYRVRDSDLDRNLAVKVLRRDRQGNPQYEQRFQEEAQILGQLQHPGIVPIHKRGRLPDGRPFFTMKLIEGQTLADLLRVGQVSNLPRADLPRFLTIFEQICQTVAYAHSRRVIHRDLKPANIMVGAFGEVQVMDWGLAKARKASRGVADLARVPSEPTSEVLRLPLPPDTVSEFRPARGDTPRISTQTGLAMGTWPYMATEQARGEVDQLDERCDVFSLGAILCEILTGQPPYTGPTQADLAYQAKAGDLTDANARLACCGADAELVELAHKCLARDRCQRPHDAEAVAEAVTAYEASVQARLRQADVERAAAEGRAQEAKAKARAVKALLAVSAVAILALVGIAAGLWHSAQLQTLNEGLTDAKRQLESTNESLETANHQKEVTHGKLEAALKVIRQEKAEVEKHRQQARRFLYVSQINLADRAYKEGKPGLALQLLETVRPEALGGEDLRGPEWYHLWNANNGYAYSLSGHTAPITSMVFSPNGQWLAAGATDGRIIIWDTREAKIHQTFSSGDIAVSALQFTEDSKVLLATGGKAALGAWDVDTGRRIVSPSAIGEGDLVVSHALSRLISVEKERARLAKVLTPPPERGAINGLAGTPDGRFAAVAFERRLAGREEPNGEVTVHDLGKGNRVYCYQQPKVIPCCVSLSLCGRVVAWGGMDQAIHVRHVDGNGMALSFVFNSAPRSLVFSFNREYLASAHADQRIRVWKLHPRKPDVVFNAKGRVNNVVMSPNGKQLAACDRRANKIWEIATWKELHSWGGPFGLHDAYQRLAYSVDGRLISDGLRITDAISGREYSQLKVCSTSYYASTPYATAFSPDRTLVATACAKGVFVWDVATGMLVRSLEGLQPCVSCVAFSPDGKLLAAGSSWSNERIRGKCGGVMIWDVVTGRELHRFPRELPGTNCVLFSPDGKWLAAGRGNHFGSSPGEIKIWDTENWTEIYSLEHNNSVWGVAFSPDGRRLASASGRFSQGNGNGEEYGQVKVWDLTKGQELLTLHDHSCIYGVAFSPNGKVLVSGSAVGTIRFWGDLSGLSP